MKKTAILVCGIALTGVITGCQNDSVNTISNAGVIAKITRINDKRVDTDSRLAERLCLTEIRESKTNDGYTRIQVFLKNMPSRKHAAITDSMASARMESRLRPPPCSSPWPRSRWFPRPMRLAAPAKVVSQPIAQPFPKSS